MKTLSNKITLNLDSGAEINVKGFIAPVEYTQYNFHVEWDELANFRVAEPEKRYPTSAFQAFLPSEPVAVGECWEIQEEGALTLLKQLHPNPRLKLTIDSGDSYGLWGCLRAYNDGLAEIVFRIHAEFIMESGKFTPSQFAGCLVIDRLQERVISFKMSVPPTTINFDAGWTRDEATAAEIGFCPKMELSAGTPPHDAEFTASITEKEAERELSSCFYKFQKINWVSLEEALEMAPAQEKPIHVISVDGPLFDEAC
jgi:hypothetical protein